MPIVSLTVNRNSLRAALLFSAVSDVRYYLNGVMIEARKASTFIVATDGRRAGVFKSATIADNLPADGLEIIVPVALVKSVKSFKALPDITVLYDTETRTVTIQDVDGAQSAKAVDGKFPDWRRIVPAQTTGDAAQFDPELIADLAKVAKALGRKPQLVHVHFNGTGAAVVTISGESQFLGVVMPLVHKPETVQAVPGDDWKTAA